ncbi:MAG: DUF3795 domain-containing protein [Deltaproteobacteria bacterium]|nr:DUF3795 domain-containing protein [Deltaproteobacteria bacterium]
MKDKQALTSPCGLDCFNCIIYEDNLSSSIAAVLNDSYGWPLEEIACKGCRQQDGKHVHLPQGCATLDCVKAKGVEFCCDCDEFPCAFLAPVADMAALRPHNIKVYNLCRIKKIGIERWIEEEAGQIRTKYFTNNFVAGRGLAD